MTAEEVYTPNSVARLSAEFHNSAGADTDPTTVTIGYTAPGGTVTTKTWAGGDITKDATGKFHYDLTVTTPGTYYWYYKGTGTVAVEEEFYFFVKPDYTAAHDNKLAWLQWRLATKLRDPEFATWSSFELAKLLTTAVAGLYPRVSRELDRSAVTVTLVAGTYDYALPSGCEAVSRIDRVDASSNYCGSMGLGTWEVIGGKVHVHPYVADSMGGTLYLVGYGRYDTSTNPVPDELVPLVLARARAEAYRVIAGDRVRFEQWITQNQTQNVTVNELLGLVNDADAEAERLWKQAPRTVRRPVPARRGSW